MQCSVRARTGGLMFSVRLDARPCLKGTSALLPSIATWCGASIRFGGCAGLASFGCAIGAGWSSWLPLAPPKLLRARSSGAVGDFTDAPPSLKRTRLGGEVIPSEPGGMGTPSIEVRVQ